MLDSAVSFVSVATGGLTRGKTLHEADFAAKLRINSETTKEMRVFFIFYLLSMRVGSYMR